MLLATRTSDNMFYMIWPTWASYSHF